MSAISRLWRKFSRTHPHPDTCLPVEMASLAECVAKVVSGIKGTHIDGTVVKSAYVDGSVVFEPSPFLMAPLDAMPPLAADEVLTFHGGCLLEPGPLCESFGRDRNVCPLRHHRAATRFGHCHCSRQSGGKRVKCCCGRDSALRAQCRCQPTQSSHQGQREGLTLPALSRLTAWTGTSDATAIASILQHGFLLPGTRHPFTGYSTRMAHGMMLGW